MKNRQPAKVPQELDILLNTIDIQNRYLAHEDTYGAVNQAHADFVGKPREALAYRPIADFLEPADPRAGRRQP